MPNGNYYALIDSAANQKTLAGVKSVSELFYDLGITVNSKVNKDIREFLSWFSEIKYIKENITNMICNPNKINKGLLVLNLLIK